MILDIRGTSLISGWGNYPKIDANIILDSTEEDAVKAINSFDSIIAMGNARSYGDSALGTNILSLLPMNHFLDFDENTGILQCEAGVLLSEILDVAVPRGWFLSVTPGTKLITVGGAIASDVHGKDHHVSGSFSKHVISMDVLLSSGKIIKCSQKSNADLFQATAGGMGLTGIILRAAIQLKKIESAYIKQKLYKARNLKHIMELFEENKNVPLTMAWIDCIKGGKNMGRSILYSGHHATADECTAAGIKNPLDPNVPKKITVPFNFPSFALNSLSVRAFNFFTYHKQSSKTTSSIVSYDSFFYPLDSIYMWNRIYGKRGFTQYQFVLPMSSSAEGIDDILKRISKSGMGSFLAVLKQLGKENKNLISFPMEGYTLALDFPITRKLFPFLNELDRMVTDYGGRVYLTKDARMSAAMFRRTYRNAEKFINYKHNIDKKNIFRSLQSERLGI